MESSARWLFAASAAMFLGSVALTVRAQNQTVRVAQFDNPAVKVWRTTIMPKAPLTLHRHDHARVIVALAGGTIKVAPQKGASEMHVWETGKAYWLTADPPGQLHTDEVIGDKPMEVMVVELQK